MMKRYLVFLVLMAGLGLLSGCSRCSGKLSPEAERSMTGGRLAADENDGETAAVQEEKEPGEAAAADAETSYEVVEAEEGGGAEGQAAPTVTDVLVRPGRMMSVPEQILQRKAYMVSFNEETLLPNWVAWKLTREMTYGKEKRGGIKFQEDFDVDARHRVTTYDYNRSGYDRGHMCPAGDSKWDRQAMEESFLMTNICPQAHALNSGDWNDLETLCRSWARRYGEVYIVCGPIVPRNGGRKIGRRRKITVPAGFFKVVLCMQDTPKAIGFVFENEDGGRAMASYVQSVDDVERLTSIDFFPALPDDVERNVEAHADLRKW